MHDLSNMHDILSEKFNTRMHDKQLWPLNGFVTVVRQFYGIKKHGACMRTINKPNARSQ